MKSAQVLGVYAGAECAKQKGGLATAFFRSANRRNVRRWQVRHRTFDGRDTAAEVGDVRRVAGDVGRVGRDVRRVGGHVFVGRKQLRTVHRFGAGLVQRTSLHATQGASTFGAGEGSAAARRMRRAARPRRIEPPERLPRDFTSSDAATHAPRASFQTLVYDLFTRLIPLVSINSRADRLRVPRITLSLDYVNRLIAESNMTSWYCRPLSGDMRNIRKKTGHLPKEGQNCQSTDQS